MKLPPFSSSWAEAISCQHHTIINWKENGTKWLNCGLKTDAKNELNVNKPHDDKFNLASLVRPVARKRDAYLMMLRHSAILERERLQGRRAEDETMLLQDHVVEHSPQRTESRVTGIAAMPQDSVVRAPAVNTDSERGTRRRTSQLEWTASASSPPPPPFFAERCRERQARPLSFCISSVSFLRRFWRGCGVPAMFMLTRDTLSTSFSIVVWEEREYNSHPQYPA